MATEFCRHAQMKMRKDPRTSSMNACTAIFSYESQGHRTLVLAIAAVYVLDCDEFEHLDPFCFRGEWSRFVDGADAVDDSADPVVGAESRAGDLAAVLPVLVHVEYRLLLREWRLGAVPASVLRGRGRCRRW